MILFLSDGRLGNQIFQYAFLNAKAKKNEKVFCFNMSQFVKYFDVNNKKFYFLSSSRFTLFLYRNFLLKLLHFLVKIRVIGYIEQLRPSTPVLPEIIEKKGLIPLTYIKTGFFQSEGFFIPKKPDISLKTEYIQKAESILSNLPKQEKVFIHVRRGDYLFVTYQGERGIDLPKEYFIDAINEIEKNIENPFYIFLTDDPGYVRYCFQDINNKFISEENMAIDLAIMSLCKYGVVSNSSFSWWGAFLAKEKKIMVFPKYWYGWKKRMESHLSIQPSWGTIIDVIIK